MFSCFCPECGHNIGFGTLESIGCPVCGYDGDCFDDLDEFEEEEDDPE